MGNPRGFLDFKKQTSTPESPSERIKHYKEFYTPLPKVKQQIQAGRCMDCGVAFCHTGVVSPAQHNICHIKPTLFMTHQGVESFSIQKGEIGCPLRNLIPEWNDLVYKAQWKQGYDRLKLTNPFGEFTGRVCPAPCEDSCVCAINGESVAIKNTELAIVENAFKDGFIKPFNPKKRSLKHIAVIGSGPAGLACANELNALGHNVVVFERSDRIGGLLMYGIPDMKLEKSVINRRVEVMKQSGIAFRVNEHINSKARVEALLEEFDALVLATGASKPIDLDIEGRYIKSKSKNHLESRKSTQGIMFAIDFLTDNTKSLLNKHKGSNLAKDKDVLIIGSGDTSVDCVAVALRQGAKSITRFERSPKRATKRTESNPWPLKKQTFYTDYGLEEAIAYFGSDVRQYQKLTKHFIVKNNKVCGAVAVDLEWKNEGGKQIRNEILGSQKEYKADLVLLAMGFSGSEDAIERDFGVAFDRASNVATTNYATSRDRIYACGDSRMGQSLVVWAIRDGLECAHFVHKGLQT